MVSRKKIWLAQQAVWRAKQGGRKSMPLAAGYLKSMVEADEALASESDVRIFNFSGADSTLGVIKEMFLDELPDVVGFSILGWNYNLFGRVSETYRQLKPDGWVMWGGTHAANQAERIFGSFSSVDIVVNGEGELCFLDIMRAYISGRSRHELDDIEGISFKMPDGRIKTTNPRPRIMDLNIIPSPFLTGAMPITNSSGDFLYDSALLETNRGCPYACAFCYWGGAIGQKIRSFSIDRLSEEIELLARSGAEDIVLCDANFGMLNADEEFLEICIKAREKYGFPKHIMTSWAKNKGKTFYGIVRRMKETGFHSSFNLALQSLSDPVLKDMGRKNMKVNEWEDLAEWLEKEGMDLYGELIWGCPGESYDSFLESYDALAKHVPHIATYPHMMLPNTTYTQKKREFGIVTWRGEEHDFELVLSHNTMSVADNRRMHRFLFWSRLLVEHLVFRNIWIPLRQLCGITQSQVLLDLDQWVNKHDDEVSATLRACRDQVVEALEPSSRLIEQGLEYIFTEPAFDPLIEDWWREDILPRIDEPKQQFFMNLLRYDWLTRPIYRRAARPSSINGDNGTRDHAREQPSELSLIEIGGEQHYVRENIEFDYDVPALLAKLKGGEKCDFSPQSTVLTFYYKTGFCSDMSLYHNAHNKAFFGTTQPGC